ncbi:MAG TPA: metal-dependent hydrolase, partial [Candidatus Acidoferrum sp.]
MDAATHALASLALARGFFPRRHWSIPLGMVVSGTIADVDCLSALFGPAAYFEAHRTWTHSLPGVVIIVLLSALLVRLLQKTNRNSLPAILLPLFCASVLHLVLDVCQSEGVALLWPFRSTRFAADWLPGTEPWILALLAFGVVLPEFFRLISSEIGAKDKTPRGRNGALVALALALVCVGARAIAHASSVALLEPHTYQGESARSIGAFPSTLSMLTWRGVVETASLLCTMDVPVAGGAPFDPESANCIHKPDASPQLTAAQETGVGRKYL